MMVKKFITYDVFNTNGEIVENNQKLDISILEESGNYLIHKDIVRHQLNQRQGTVSTKTRSEVRGGGKKPWRQKGTGRARAGSNTSPLWKGGGVIFGPKPHKTIIKINQKERQLALRTLLYNKQKNISVIDNLELTLTDSKTKSFTNFCNSCDIDLNQNILLIVSEKTLAIKLSTKNLKNVELISAKSLNTLSLLRAKQVLLTPLAIKMIKETFCD
uniref:Large ribosomal subunit protein uL4c n=1 Tax=Coscinodiscus granii TaxID=265552 RepID=A0A8A6KH55_9STRA|nr:ribosomal protein L4 [Coscinodiscus granii]QTI82917.1 ribosomal protein L4 [Coscinodiscus granii]